MSAADPRAPGAPAGGRALGAGLGRRYTRAPMRRVASICAAVLLTAAFTAVAGAAAPTPLARQAAVLRRVAPPGGGYSVELPAPWRFANASYPSDHATHLWFDPSNALRRMIVVLSGCVGCAQRDGAPNPDAGVPAGATHVVRLSADEAAFQQFTSADDPWLANGISVVMRHDGAIVGYATAELWLPPAQHSLATTILNSFRLTG